MALKFLINKTKLLKTFQIVKTLILRIILRKLQNSEKNSKNKTILVNVSEHGPMMNLTHCTVLPEQSITCLVVTQWDVTCIVVLTIYSCNGTNLF